MPADELRAAIALNAKDRITKQVTLTAWESGVFTLIYQGGCPRDRFVEHTRYSTLGDAFEEIREQFRDDNNPALKVEEPDLTATLPTRAEVR